MVGGRVIRFLDWKPLLPADAGPDQPKIIKHGIPRNDDGPMHPDSPRVSGLDGAVTLLYNMKVEKWIQKLIDFEGTKTFKVVLGEKPEYIYSDIYINRDGLDVEMGFLGDDKQPSTATRYRIEPQSKAWKPISAIDDHLDPVSGQLKSSGWLPGDVRVRKIGENFAHHIWKHLRWDLAESVEVEWDGMTAADREEKQMWLAEYMNLKEETEQNVDEQSDDILRQWMKTLGEDEEKRRARDKKLRDCRGGCGKEKCHLCCSACKEVYYCSPKCQRDDWKWHKTLCGKAVYFD